MGERVEPIFVAGDLLYDIGMVEKLPANNSPRWTYRPNPERPECEHVVDLPVNESFLWCPLCTAEGKRSQLKKVLLAPYCEQVWFSHFNPTTGRMESDRKAMQRHLTDHSHRISDELGIGHEFKRIDPSEVLKERAAKGADRKGKTVEGALVSTHDRAVAEGRKQSKGKFVY